MPDEVMVRAARPADVDAIVAVFRANLADASLFQRSAAEIEAILPDYLVAVRDDTIAGCAALSCYPDQSAEIHSVAVLPHWQGQHIGHQLMRACLQRAARAGVDRVWLATMKPDYFARFGFAPIPRWRIPPRILLPKLKGVFAQPPARWLPALLGSHTFMLRRASR